MTNFPNKCVKGFITILLVTTHLAYAETSVYGFGTDEPESDVQMSSLSSANTIPALKLQIAQQQERIDGLTTIIEGLSATINELQQKSMSSASTEQSDASNTALLKKLASMIDEINANYVT